MVIINDLSDLVIINDLSDLVINDLSDLVIINDLSDFRILFLKVYSPLHIMFDQIICASRTSHA